MANSTHLPNVTPEQFLATVFGDFWMDDAWVASVADLAPSAQTNADFYGCRAAYMHWSQNANSNCYYAMGAIKQDAGASRKAVYWSHGRVVVLDDVHEKGEATKIIDAFGEPSFKVQTSLGSEQWGYLLETPVRDPVFMARLMRACTIAFYPSGKDPGHEPIVQYVRMPCGVNNKAKRVKENGGSAPPVFLREWHPDRKFEALDLIIALGEAWDEAEHQVRGTRGSQTPIIQTPQQAHDAALDDEVLLGLDKLGMVEWDHLQNGGYIQITCPWHGTHTQNDDRTGWNPLLAHKGGAFWCFHGSHGKKTDDDVRDFLEYELGKDEWKKICDQAFAHRRANTPMPFTAVEETENEDGSVSITVGSQTITVRPTQTAKRPMLFRPIAKGMPIAAREQPPKMSAFLERGVTSVLAGPSMAGKSLLALATACSLAVADPVKAQAALGEALDYTGNVYYVSNEDNDNVLNRRRDGWLNKNSMTAADFAREVYQVQMPNFIAASRPDKYAPIELSDHMRVLGERIEADRAAGQDVCLVVLDTMASILQGVEENSNSDLQQTMTVLDSWARKHNVAVLILHHMQKNNGKGTGGGQLASLRGAGAIGNAVRIAYTLTTLSEEEEKLAAKAGEGNCISILEPAKLSHDKMEGKRYFKRIGQLIEVYDPRTNAKTQDETGVIVPLPKCPDYLSDKPSPDMLLNIVQVVCEADAANDPFGVKAGRTLKARVVKLLDVPDATAGKLIKECEGKGWIEIGDGLTQAHRHGIKVWRPTADGAKLVEERKAELEAEAPI